MKTTLNEIFKHNPCGQWRRLLLKNLGKTSSDDEPLDLMEILESDDIEGAVWSLRCFEYRDYCLFLADVAESVLYIFEENFQDDDRPRLLIQGIRDYHAGNSTKKELENLRLAADAVNDTANNAADVYSSDAADNTVADAVNDTVNNAADAYSDDTDDDAIRRKKQQEIKTLFIKHFGGNKQ